MNYYIRGMNYRKNSNILPEAVKNEIMEREPEHQNPKKVKDVPNWMFLLFAIGLLTALLITRFS